MNRVTNRIQREMATLQQNPTSGIMIYMKEKSLKQLEAKITGKKGGVYEEGVFKISIQIPDRYPFEPPTVKFITPIYHPNIDDGGRICLDILNMPPKGSWRPTHTLYLVLQSIRMLMDEPNPEDGLMADISDQYQMNREAYEKEARKYTKAYAIQQHQPEEKRKTRENDNIVDDRPAKRSKI